MAAGPVSYEQVFWQSRVSAAFRTGWACLMVGIVMQYSSMHHHWLAFPVFAYVVTVTVVGEASFGEALRSAFSVLIGTLHGAFPTIAILWLIKPQRFSVWATTACVTVSCFFIAYAKVVNITSKRVAFAQVVIIYISAFMMRETMDSITYPLRIAGTTALGAGCALLALILPVPKLACYQFQEKSKLSARITSEVFRLLAEAFNADEYEEANSLRFQAKSLSTAGGIILKQVEDNQVDLKWELPAIGCLPSVRLFSKEYGKLKQSLAGMEMALKFSPPSQIGDTTHVLLADPLLHLTTWASLALNHAGSASMSANPMLGHNEFILEQGKEALKSFDEALAIVIQRICGTYMQKPYTNKPTSLPIPDHELGSANSEELDKVRQATFKYHLPMCFFVFSMKHLCKEAIDMIRPCAERVQQIAPLNHGSQSTEGYSYCHQCSLPLRTISINIDALQEETSQVVMKSKLIWQFLCNAISCIDTNRLLIASKCSVSLGLSVLLGVLFSHQRGYWAGIAVAISMGTSREATFKLANVRAQGTVAGSVYAVIASILTAESILLRAVALIPWVIFTSFLRQSKMYGYAGGLSAFLAAIIILGRKDVDPPSEFAIVRITETFIGIGCYILVELILQPRRASTLARKELVVVVCSLQDFTSSLISAQNSKGCVHSHALALLELKEKEKKVKDHICSLSNYIEEAKVEPDFWFLPFPATTYSKLLNSYCKIADLLHFAMLSHEYIVDSCARNDLSVETIYGFIQDDLQGFESRVSEAFQCFAEVLRVKSPRKLIMQSQHIEHSRSKNLQSGTRLASVHDHGGLPGIHINIEHHPNSNYHSVLVGHGPYDIAGDEEFTLSLIKSVQEVVTHILCLQDEISSTNDFVISLSSLALCLENIVTESKEIEKAIHELLQWENPWSLIDLWEIYDMINGGR